MIRESFGGGENRRGKRGNSQGILSVGWGTKDAER